jgi:hypothetical protein
MPRYEKTLQDGTVDAVETDNMVEAVRLQAQGYTARVARTAAVRQADAENDNLDDRVKPKSSS